MTTFGRLAAAVAVVAAFGGVTPRATADWKPGGRMAESAGVVLDNVQNVTKNTRYGYTDDICLLAAFLGKGEKVSFSREFKRGEKYAVIGGGDSPTRDLDIEIVDRAGKVIDSDTEIDAKPAVLFQVPATGHYTIRVVMADAGENGGFATIAVLREGGFVVPQQRLAQAVGRLLAGCEAVDSNVKEKVYFASGGNQWAMYGTILDKGEALTVSGQAPRAERRVWVGAADAGADDIDLELQDGNGKPTASDRKPDANPLVSRFLRADERYKFKISNEKSDGLTLVTVAALNLSN